MKHAVVLGIIVALCAVPALAGAEPGPELCFADALELMYENNALSKSPSLTWKSPKSTTIKRWPRS